MPVKNMLIDDSEGRLHYSFSFCSSLSITLYNWVTGVLAKQAINRSLLVIVLLSVVDISQKGEWPILTLFFSFSPLLTHRFKHLCIC